MRQWLEVARQDAIDSICKMIDIWKIHLAEAKEVWAQSSRLLTPEEHERAASFRRESDRMRFSCARITRRLILGGMLGIDPAYLTFGESEHGKPYLQHPAEAQLLFNSSHSGDWVLHAISDRQVGIDIEQVTPDADRVNDLLWVFSRSEQAALRRSAGRDREKTLTRLWVRKEAYVKAIGEGLGGSLADISIIDDSEGRPVLEFDRNKRSGQTLWRFTDLEIAEDYAACVVFAGPSEPITVRELIGT